MINKIIPILTIAAMLVLLVIPIVKNNTTGGAYALMSIDINESIELELDSDKKVVSAYGINKNGEKTDLKELKGKTLEEAIDILKSSFNYNSNDKEGIVGFTFMNNINNKT
jgi:hypothetical protein